MSFQNQRSPGLIVWLRSDRYFYKRFNIAYNRLIYQVQHISKRENQSKLNSLHVLVRIPERLARLLECCDDRIHTMRLDIRIPNIQSHTLYIVYKRLSMCLCSSIFRNENAISSEMVSLLTTI